MSSRQPAGGSVSVHRFGRLVAVGLVVAALCSACSATKSRPQAAPSSPLTTAPPPSPSAATQLNASATGPIVIVATPEAAGILSVALPPFEQQNPGTKVSVVYATTSQLARDAAAPGVTAVVSSDQASLGELADGGTTYQPVEFIRTILQLVVAPSDPLGIMGLGDLTASDSVGVLPATTIAGRAADAVLAGAGGGPTVVVPNPAAMIGDLADGKIKAGLLEIPDVVAAGSTVRAFDLPSGTGATNFYVAVKQSAQDGSAQGLVDALTVGSSSQALIAHSYLLPSPDGSSDG